MGESADHGPGDPASEWRLLCHHTLALFGWDGWLMPGSAGASPEATSLSPAPTIALDPRAQQRAPRTAPLAEPSSPPLHSARTHGRSEHGLVLGAAVLPVAHQWPGEPFALEPMAASHAEAFSDLRAALEKGKLCEDLPPPSDEAARREQQVWRQKSGCADIVLVGAAGESSQLHQRLVEALSGRCCPAVWVDVDRLGSAEGAEAILLHPAVRLILLTPEALARAPWLHTLWREEASGTSWQGRAAIRLAPAEHLETHPEAKRHLWEGLQAWKRVS
jgi:hypothetical protein